MTVDCGPAALAISHALVVTDCTQPDNPIIFVNPAFSRLTGYPAEEAIGRNCRFLQGPDTSRETLDAIRATLAGGGSIRCELLNYRKDGSSFWNELVIDPIRGSAGQIVGYVGAQNDATPKQMALQGRQEAERRLAAIVDNLPGYVFQRMLRPDGTIEHPYVSPSIYRILGLPEDADGSPGQLLRLVHPEDHDPLQRAMLASAANLTPLRAEFRLINAAGQPHWFRMQSSPHALADGAVAWYGLAIDINAEKSSELELAHRAQHDALTGLSNRARFQSSLIAAIAGIATTGIARCHTALFVIDINDFQAINASFGLPFGDWVLRRVGLRLLEFAEARGGSAARLGGDEFAVLLPALATDIAVLDLASLISQQTTRGMLIEGQEVGIEVCVGAATFPSAGDVEQAAGEHTWAELMKRAQLALDAAKREGPGSCRQYAEELDDRVRNRMALRQSLRRAISEAQFELHYQPLVDLGSGAIVGAEALVRWNHPDLGMQRPDLFIPLAESSGLIVPLGAWVVGEAMRQAQAWRQRGIASPRIAINVSSVQLQRPGFVAVVEQALQRTGADPRHFELELTEGLLIEASAETHAQLDALKSLGFQLVIDDFGTGHSTFRYLRDFPVDKMKIDQSFVRQLVLGSSDASIIRAMIALARSLGIACVAEGIETTMQRDFLRGEGCRIGQGYLFSMPLAAEDFGWLLEQRLTLPIARGAA